MRDIHFWAEAIRLQSVIELCEEKGIFTHSELIDKIGKVGKEMLPSITTADTTLVEMAPMLPGQQPGQKTEKLYKILDRHISGPALMGKK